MASFVSSQYHRDYTELFGGEEIIVNLDEQVAQCRFRPFQRANCLPKSTTKVNEMVLKNVLQIFCLIFLFVSCYKVEPTTLEVTVKDNTGNVISNAVVYVEGEPTVSPYPSVEAIYESETKTSVGKLLKSLLMLKCMVLLP